MARLLKEAEEAVEELLGYRDPDDILYQAAVILILSAGRLKNVFNMRRATGYPKENVNLICRNFRASGIWRGRGAEGVRDKNVYTQAYWEDGLKGQISFVLNAMVGAGLVSYVPPE